MVHSYGVRADTLAQAGAVLARVLPLHFVAHESDSRGGNYHRAEASGGEVFLQPNQDVLDGSSFEEEWPSDGLILRLDGPQGADWTSIMNALERLELQGIVKRLGARSI